MLGNYGKDYPRKHCVNDEAEKDGNQKADTIVARTRRMPREVG